MERSLSFIYLGLGNALVNIQYGDESSSRSRLRNHLVHTDRCRSKPLFRPNPITNHQITAFTQHGSSSSRSFITRSQQTKPVLGWCPFSARSTYRLSSFNAASSSTRKTRLDGGLFPLDMLLLMPLEQSGNDQTSLLPFFGYLPCDSMHLPPA